MATFSHGSKERLTAYDLTRFPSDSLFDRIGRTVCDAGCLPRKELYEAWEVARRVRRLFRGGRVVDVAAGHGLLAHVLLILDDSSPRAVAIEPAVPPSAAKLQAALVAAWPRLGGRVAFEERPLGDVALGRDDVIVSSHACGPLTDVVLERAMAAGARVAVLPCCHELAVNDAGPLRGWMDGPLAVDAMRALRLHQHGYRVWTQTIPSAVTPKNRLLLGAPSPSASATQAAR